MRRLRNVKIVATLGPASSTYDTIKALHEAGADVFRLNMSHGSHDEIAERHRIIRQIEDELSSPIAILADLQGPKLRVGTFANEAEELAEGDTSVWIWILPRATKPAFACPIKRFLKPSRRVRTFW